MCLGSETTETIVAVVRDPFAGAQTGPKQTWQDGQGWLSNVFEVINVGFRDIRRKTLARACGTR